MKKKHYILAGLVLLLIALIIIFYAFYQKAKEYKTEVFFDNDTVITTIDDQNIYASQLEIYKLIKCYELIINNKKSSAGKYLENEYLKKEIIGIFIISNESNIDTTKITTEEKQSDLGKNLKIIFEGVKFTDETINEKSKEILKVLNENVNIENTTIKKAIENIKYINQEKFINTIRDIVEKDLIFKEYYNEYSQYMVKQNYSQAEIWDNFYNKHLVDVKGKYIINIKE